MKATVSIQGKPVAITNMDALVTQEKARRARDMAIIYPVSGSITWTSASTTGPGPRTWPVVRPQWSLPRVMLDEQDDILVLSTVVVVERVQSLVTKNLLRRVRIGRTQETRGSLLVDGAIHPMKVITTEYLDGRVRECASAGLYFTENEMANIVPARSKDITDFGRLTDAAKALVVSMATYGPGNDPSPEQLAIFVAGYRNLLEWRRKVRTQMTQAEGQIDAVEAMLTRIL